MKITFKKKEKAEYGSCKTPWNTEDEKFFLFHLGKQRHSHHKFNRLKLLKNILYGYQYLRARWGKIKREEVIRYVSLLIEQEKKKNEDIGSKI